MTSNFVPYFCEVCEHILPPPNIGSKYVTCKHCFSQNEIGKNTIVIEQTYNLPKQSIDNEALRNLAKSLTTDKILYDCTECQNDIFSKIHDQNMTHTLVCDGCGAIYSLE